MTKYVISFKYKGHRKTNVWDVYGKKMLNEQLELLEKNGAIIQWIANDRTKKFIVNNV